MTTEELWLYNLCKKNGIFITDIQLERLSAFKHLVLEWNKKINLVSRKNEDRLWVGHIALSISMLFKIEFQKGLKILDLGTGGGFPGIPLAILLSDSSFLLLDSTQKKIAAVQSIIDKIGLKNVRTIWGRAEELQKKIHLRNSFDLVIARSVSGLSNLLAWGLPFLKNVEGKNIEKEKMLLCTPSLITFKGADIEEEEKKAKREYPNIQLKNIPLIFYGNEEIDTLDKKLIVATKH
jgi:16S rRNA (guanine527-N7)-methyltransferase